MGNQRSKTPARQRRQIQTYRFWELYRGTPSADGRSAL